MVSTSNSEVTRRAFLAAGACVLCSAASGAVGFGIGRERDHRTITPGSSDVAGSQGKTADPEGGLLDPGGVSRTHAERVKAQPDALFRVKTPKPYVGMTFDDGPDVRYSAKVLDLLGEREMTATFFMIGVNALANPDLARRALHEGHTVGNHTFDHAELELLRPAAIESEIDRGGVALAKAGLGTPHWFRPPKGYTDEAVGVIADAERYRTVFWELAVEHFVDHQDVDKGVDQMLERVRPGMILLAHDGGHVVGVKDRPTLSRERTMEALPLLLDGLRKKGFQAMNLDDLVERA